jgi:excisionase family DNA binding protein
MLGNDVPLSEKKFFTHEEFGSLVGVKKITVYWWVRKGYLRAARFSPRCVMIPRAELERYEKGEIFPPPGPKEGKRLPLRGSML